MDEEPCWKKHPGLCTSRDATFFAHALSAAKRVNAYFAAMPQDQALGSAWMFEARDYASAWRQQLFVITAFIQYAPRICVFLRCHVEEDCEDDFTGRSALHLVVDNKLNFVATYGLLGELFRRAAAAPTECHTIEMAMLDLTFPSGVLELGWVAPHTDMKGKRLEVHGLNPIPETIPRKKQSSNVFEAALDQSETMQNEMTRLSRRQARRVPAKPTASVSAAAGIDCPASSSFP